MATIAPPTPAKQRTFGEMLGGELRALPVVVALMALWLFFAFQNDVFLTPRNIANLLQQSTVVGIMALGLMFVLLVKEIDLSVAAIHGVTAVMSAMLIVDYGVSPWVALPIAVVVGAIIGSCSARWVNWVGVPSFVVTLGLGLALNGFQLLLLPPTARYGLMGTGVEVISQTTISGGYAWLVWIVGVAAFGLLALSRFNRRRSAGLESSAAKSLVLPVVVAALIGGWQSSS
jgi:D-xylose transport system permease protein